MTLADLSSIASIISGLAVLVSLVYLGLQTRQNVRHTRALIQQQRGERAFELATRMAETDWTDGMMACMAGSPDVNAKDFVSWSFMTRAAFLYWEDGYLQHRQGLLTGEAFDSFEAQLRANLAITGVRAGWKMGRHGFSPGMQKYIDDISAQTPANRTLDRRMDEWKAAVAEVNSTVPGPV